LHTVFEGTRLVGCSKHLGELTTDLLGCRLPQILLSLHVILDRLDDLQHFFTPAENFCTEPCHHLCFNATWLTLHLKKNYTYKHCRTMTVYRVVDRKSTRLNSSHT